MLILFLHEKPVSCEHIASVSFVFNTNWEKKIVNFLLLCLRILRLSKIRYYCLRYFCFGCFLVFSHLCCFAHELNQSDLRSFCFCFVFFFILEYRAVSLMHAHFVLSYSLLNYVHHFWNNKTHFHSSKWKYFTNKKTTFKILNVPWWFLMF